MKLIRKNVQDIALSTLKGLSLIEALDKFKIQPLDFYNHLNNHPEDKALFNSAKIALIENELSNLSIYIDSAETKLDLDKANSKASLFKWLAEKIIPETYGQKIQVEKSVTIDIRQVLDEARSRISIDNRVIDLGIDRALETPQAIDITSLSSKLLGED